MIIALAKPSIAPSMPKPTRAIEPAAMPAMIATAPSTVIQSRLSQDRSLTRRASRSYSTRGGRGDWGS
jgi:hypothetical protein